MADDYLAREEATGLLHAAVDNAFSAEVDRCFHLLVDAVERSDPQAARLFANGVLTAERAREIALDVVTGR